MNYLDIIGPLVFFSFIAGFVWLVKYLNPEQELPYCQHCDNVVFTRGSG